MVGTADNTEFSDDGISRFEEAMDFLAEKMSSLGFPLSLYTHIDTPRRPDGTFNPLPLTLRNFPRNWDRRWQRFARVKPPSYVPLPDRVSGTGGRMFRA